MSTPEDKDAGPSSEAHRKDELLARMRLAKHKADQNRDARSQTQASPTRAPIRFDALPEYKRVKLQRRASQAIGVANPFYRHHDRAAGATTQINGRELLNFASYDYLDANTSPEVTSAAKAAVDRYGISASASRLVAGERPIHAELEANIASLYGVEAAVCFVSGYLTNVATISCIMGPNDLVIHDEFIHNSALSGIKQSGAARRLFRHNDTKHLEEVLRTVVGDFRRVLVVAEGIYSMDGDVVDLPALVELRSRYGFWLMIDEAHSLGVLGRSGRGSLEHFGIDPTEVDIWMGTLSKASSSCGGYVAGSQALIDILKAEAGGFVYSVGLSPVLAAAANASLNMLRADKSRVEKLHKNGSHFLDFARAAGLDTGRSQGFSVVPVLVGDSLRAVQLSHDLLEEGINVLPIIYPAIPEGTARLRFFITSRHTEDQLRFAAEATARRLKELEARNFGLASLNVDQLMEFSALMDEVGASK